MTTNLTEGDVKEVVRGGGGGKRAAVNPSVDCIYDGLYRTLIRDTKLLREIGRHRFRRGRHHHTAGNSIMLLLYTTFYVI